MADLEDVRWAVEALRWTKQRKAEIKDVEEQARDAIEQALGDDDHGTLDDHTVVTWKYGKRNMLDQKYLKQKFPEIAAECRVVTEVRRFEIVDE